MAEVGGNNRGPMIEAFLACVGLPPGQAWCAAFVAWCYQQAAREFGGRSPLPRTGKVTRLWRRCPAHWRSRRPTPGAIFCHATDPQDPESPGHCGIVIGGGGDEIATIEGNTSEFGARDGDGVRARTRPLGYVNLGFIDIGRFGPPARTV